MLVVRVALKLCEWIVVAASAVMIVITLAQVVCRYVLQAPLTWSEELARYMFVYIVYLAAPIALHRGLHIGVDNVTVHLSRRVQRVLEILNDLVALGLVLVIGYASLEVLQANQLQFSPALNIRMSHVYVAIPLCMLVMAIVLVAKLGQGEAPPSSERGGQV
jgi:TRAP-type C4-dicarboxylate transport system permease small subunit